MLGDGDREYLEKISRAEGTKIYMATLISSSLQKIGLGVIQKSTKVEPGRLKKFSVISKDKW